MTAANQQIVTAFEETGMTPEEISQELGYELAAIKSILMQSSSVYRKICRKDEDADTNFTEEEHTMARQVIANAARYSEDENLKFRAACYIRDDKKGRLDTIKANTGLNINVVMFNEQIAKARKAKDRALEGRVIEALPA